MNQTSLPLPEYNRINTYTYKQFAQVQLNIHKCRLAHDYKHTHHARKQRNRHSNSSGPDHIYTIIHASNLSGIARQLHIMAENIEKQTFKQIRSRLYIYTHKHALCLFRSYTSKCYYIWHARLCRLHILFLLDCEVEVPSRTVHFISHRLTLLMCPKIIFRLQFFSFSSTLIMPPKTIFRLQAFFFSSRRNYHSNDNVCRAIEYQLQDAREAVAI